MRQLTTSAAYRTLSNGAAAGTSKLTLNVIDTEGFEDVTVLVHIGAVTATGTATLSIEESDNAGGAGAVPIDGQTATATDADSNKLLAIDIHRPRKRYLVPVITRAEANSAVLSALGILHGASHTPVEQPDVADSTAFIAQ